MHHAPPTLAVLLVLGVSLAAAQAPQPGQTAAVPGGRGGQQIEPAQQLKPGLFMIVGAGANTVVRVTNEGLIVVDTKLQGDENYRALSQQIAAISKQPVRYVINTQHHPDHTGNNQKFLDAGAQIVGLDALKRYMTTDPRTKDIPGPPTVTFARDHVLRLGGVTVEMRHFGRGHTGDDTIVYFPDLKVAMVSDDVTDGAPVVDWANGGSAVEWPRVLDEILKIDFESAIPGRGAPKTKADIEAYKVKWDTLLRRGREAITAGASKERFVEQMKADDLGWPLNPQFFAGLYEELTAR